MGNIPHYFPSDKYEKDYLKMLLYAIENALPFSIVWESKRELWKELMDLKIILDMETMSSENLQKLYQERINRFKEKTADTVTKSHY